MGAGASSVPGEVCLATMLRYSHPARHGQAPSLRRWPGNWGNTLSHCNQVMPFSLMLSGSRTHCKPIAIGKPKGSGFMLHLHTFCRRTSKLQLMACEIWSAGEHCCRTCGGVRAAGPDFAISVLNSYLSPPKNTWSRCQSCRLSHGNIFPNVCSPMTSGAPAYLTQVQHMGAGASWVKG